MIITYNAVYCVCNEEFDSFCCRFTTMSLVIEHGCRIASSAWAVNTDNLFYWNTRTGNDSSTDVSLLRQNVKIKYHEYFSYLVLACRSVNRPKHVVRWYEEFPWLRNHSPHMPAHSQQSERQNIIARTHTWQQCSVSTSEAILTTKYGFNLRRNSPLHIENNTWYFGWIHVSVVHALIGPQSLKLVHFWSDIRWFPQFMSFCCLNATVPTSPPGDHSQVESPARGCCAKNSAYVNKVG